MNSSSDDNKQPWYKKYKWYLVGGAVLLVFVIIGLVIYFKMKASAPKGPLTTGSIPPPIGDEASDLMEGVPANAAPASALPVP